MRINLSVTICSVILAGCGDQEAINAGGANMGSSVSGGGDNIFLGKSPDDSVVNPDRPSHLVHPPYRPYGNVHHTPDDEPNTIIDNDESQLARIEAQPDSYWWGGIPIPPTISGGDVSFWDGAYEPEDGYRASYFSGLSNPVPAARVNIFEIDMGNLGDDRERYPVNLADIVVNPVIGGGMEYTQYNTIGWHVLDYTRGPSSDDRGIYGGRYDESTLVHELVIGFFNLQNQMDLASVDPIGFWKASGGPELLNHLTISPDCGTHLLWRYSPSATKCFDLMMLISSIPIIATEGRLAKRLEISLNTGVLNFCQTNRNGIIQELENHHDNPNIMGTISFNTMYPVGSVEYRKELLKKSFSANWLSFCPNLIPHVTEEIRKKAFYHSLVRAKYMGLTYYDGELLVPIVHRSRAFEEAGRDILLGSPERLRIGLGEYTSVQFDGENGVGRGTRVNWMATLGAQIFSSSRGIFESQNMNKYFTVKSSPHVALSNEDETILRTKLRAAGRYIGFMIYGKEKIPADLSRMMYAQMMGRTLGFEALEEYEPQIFGFYNLAKNLGEDSGIPVPEEGYPVVSNGGEVTEITEWPGDENGRIEILDRAVTNKLVSHNAKERVEIFLNALFEVVPRDVFESGISTKDLRGILFGAVEVNVDDMIRNWDVSSLSSNHQRWLTNIVRNWSQEDLRKFVEFVTGSPQVPTEGFRGYSTPFRVVQVGGSADRLPESHNCYTTLDIPSLYPSEEHMKDKLEWAINGAQLFTNG